MMVRVTRVAEGNADEHIFKNDMKKSIKNKMKERKHTTLDDVIHEERDEDKRTP